MNTLRYPKATLALLATLIYSPVLFFGWVRLDDYLIVQRAAFYTNLKNIPAAFLRSVWDPAGQEYNLYRPVSAAVYILGGWISQATANEVQPWPFHLTNLILLAALAPLFFVFFRGLGANAFAATAAAALMIIHPLTAASAGWIGGQNELLLAVWILCAWISFTRAAKSPVWFFAHGFFVLLALLTKENAVALPVLCAMHLLFGGIRGRARVWAFSVLSWAAAAAAWFLLVRQGGGENGPDPVRALLAVCEGLPFVLIYLGQWIFPVGLSTLPISLDTAWYTWAAGGIFAAAILLFAVARFKTRPLAQLGIFWLLGFLLPTFANIIPEQKDLYILRADRFFLASAGILIVLLQLDWPAAAGKKIKFATAAACAILVALNIFHLSHFYDTANFYGSAVRGSPRSPFVRTHWGDVFLNEKDYPRAVEQYQEALRLNPSERKTHNNLGVAYLRMGRVNEAEVEFKKDIEITPTSLLAWPNLGYIYLERGEYAAAEKAFRRSVEINPSFRDGWAGLIRVYIVTREDQKRADAEKMFGLAEMDMRSGL